MKRIIEIILGVMLFVSLLQAQSDNRDVALGHDTTYNKFTLTTAIDTADFVFISPFKNKLTTYTLTASSSAVDTLQVWVLSKDGTVWGQIGAVDLADNTDETTLNLTTTVHEYMLLAIEPAKIRVISLSNDGSTATCVIAGKRTE
ncbi:MAG: hypothetical protein IMZ53_09905 [Thermoplasmata archaeon]|nr:hypothetical protein [Thermoplasmata archaeon]